MFEETVLREQTTPWLDSDLRLAFVVWGPPSHGPRSQVLARELGIKSLHFIRAGTRRGVLSAPFRYAYQALEMMRRLLRERPNVVFVQSPPSLAVLVAFLYGKLTGAKYVVDAHSAAMLQRIWMWPRWMYRLLVRGAITTMVTNEHFAEMIRSEGGHALVLRDVPSEFEHSAYPLEGKRKIVVVNTFASDEPLEAILAAASQLPEIDFYITGDKRKAPAEILSLAPENSHLTGFLPNESYYGLLSSADAVICLTTRDHTMQRGACEALSLGKPIVTSGTALLRAYFDRGAVHVSNDAESIREGIVKLTDHLARYQAEILDLRGERHREWQEKKRALGSLIEHAMTQGKL